MRSVFRLTAAASRGPNTTTRLSRKQLLTIFIKTECIVCYLLKLFFFFLLRLDEFIKDWNFVFCIMNN